MNTHDKNGVPTGANKSVATESDSGTCADSNSEACADSNSGVSGGRNNRACVAGSKDALAAGGKVASGSCACAVGLPSSLPPQPLRCAFRPQRPLLLWDGQCAFCQLWARRIKRIAGHRIDCAPYQSRMQDFPEITSAQFSSAVFLILPDGFAYHSAQAVYRALALRSPFGIALWLYRNVPAFARFSDRRYRVVAASRECRH